MPLPCAINGVRSIFLVAAGLPFAALASPTLGGDTGLLTVPTAEVQDHGSAAFTASRHNPAPDRLVDPIENYALLMGFLPGLELAGRIVEGNRLDGRMVRDLSFNAKYRVWALENGPGIALGAQDLGGEAQFFRSAYAVGTWPLPALNLDLSLGYGWGPDVMEGVLGGVEWRPWSFIGVLGEYDTQDWNGGLRLESPPLFAGLRLGATAAYRAAVEDVEFGAQVSFALGGKSRAPRVVQSGAKDLLQEIPRRSAPRDDAKRSGETAKQPVAPPPADAANPALRAALEQLGFESVRVGVRDPGVQVVTLENRRYNHSSADGIGLALGAIATHAAAGIDSMELTVSTYGAPQVSVSAPVQLYRRYLADPGADESVLAQSLQAWPAAAVDEAAVRWDGVPTRSLQAVELVLEPVLRTFVATEYGVLDYGLGARGRLTVPLSAGLLFHLGAQVPVLETDDFRDQGNFEPLGPEGGLDQIMLQYLHKPAPQWTWLWSAGRAQVFRSDLDTVALEQGWSSRDGSHRLRAKLMSMKGASSSAEVALAGYTWFDPARDYSVAVSGGRFYAGDAGLRLELNRHFGDTILGAFWRGASSDDQAAGLQVSLPLTPRRDAYPDGLQIKGQRRWSHSVSTTLNAFDNRNPLRPLLLYEPTLDLDLHRDLQDAGRVGEAYLRDELPRMREVWETYGGQ